MRSAGFAVLVLIVQLSGQGHAAAATSPQPSATPWSDMDYGPFLSLTLEAPKPTGNFSYKGVVVPLKPDRSAAMVFDTDLLRWSAGWRGSFIDWKNILYDGSHGTHGRIAGDQAFGTSKRPGWARPGTDRFDDPRQLPYGPMPRDWARWRGLYRHGDRVVLSYRVGESDVLESAELIERAGTSAFTRRLHIGPRKVRLVAAVSDTAETQVELVGRGARLMRDGNSVRMVVPEGNDAIDLTLMIAAGGAEVAERLKKLVADPSATPVGLAELTRGGPARHKPVLTKADREKTRPGSPFVVDTLTLPTANPWRARIRPSGLDFFAGGRRAAVCTWDGDVWLVDGLGGKGGPRELKWTRFATGLFQPLGLVVRDEVVYVLGRDQITRLHDLNADGEADWYEAFNHDAQVTEHFHEFAMDLQSAPGPDGDFYYMKGARHAKDASVPQHGTMIRVWADGSRSEIVCYGFRAPNGLAISKEGQFFTSDQQGHWTPANRLNLIEPGKFYGYNLSYLPRPKPDSYEPPVLWLHPEFDRSPAQPLFVDSDKWGPLAGKLLLSSYGTGQIELVMTEVVDGRMQGGAVKLDLPAAATGIMRGRFNRADGQLYACGLFGWASNRTQDGGLYRVRYSQEPLRMPIALHAVKSGLFITFTDPLKADVAVDVGSYGITRWNYHRTAEYGSPDLRVADGRPGHEDVTVTSVRLSKDQRTVELNLADMRPAMQMQIKYDLESQDGMPIRGEIQSTVHATGDRSTWDRLVR
jgi:glucose/arabinose dehydrogenase